MGGFFVLIYLQTSLQPQSPQANFQQKIAASLAQNW